MKKNFLVLTLLMPLLFASALSCFVVTVNAQNQATVTILDSLGGTTNPAAGPHTYNNGDTVTITANTQSTFAFVQWIISNETSSMIDYSNPVTFTVMSGENYTVQPVFTPIQTSTLGDPPITSPTDGIMVVLAAVGGTTNPLPGYYAVSNLTQTKLTAIPDNGFEFSNWIISGFPMEAAHGDYPFTATPTDNPYTVGHGEGNRYYYQPVFTPVGNGGTSPTPTATSPSTIMGITTDMAIIIGLIVVIIVLIVAFGLYVNKNRKH
jgi:hypothetical protein